MANNSKRKRVLRKKMCILFATGVITLLALVIFVYAIHSKCTSSSISETTETAIFDLPDGKDSFNQDYVNSCHVTDYWRHGGAQPTALTEETASNEKIDDDLYRIVDDTPIEYYTFDRTDGISTYVDFNRHLKERVKNDNCIEFVNYLLLTPEGSRLLCTSLAITAMLVVIILYLLTKIAISIICRPKKTKANFVPAQARECHLREAGNTIIDKDVEVR